MTVTRHPNNQGVTLSQWRYNATGGETTLSGTDAFGAGLSYTVGAEQVFVNGVLLERGVDYTASTGTTVTGLTALVAGDIVTVSSPSAFNVANAIPKATVAAKGDLIVANGASSVTNLGVGADGTTLVANSSASTGLSWTGNQAAGKNAIINGGFDIWQRGTSSTTNLAYLADRWFNYTSAGTTTFSQESTVVPTGSRYSFKVAQASANATITVNQAIETANALQFAGKTVTFSAQVAATASTNIQIQIGYSTSVDNAALGSWTTIYASTGGSVTPTSTTFIPLVGTFAIPSTAKSLYINIFIPTLTTGTSAYIGQAQLELGAAPTTFTRAGGTLQGELAACQRYYYRMGGTAAYTMMGMGSAISTTVARCLIVNPVTMRTSPTAIDFSTLAIGDFVAGAITVTAAAIDAASPSGTTINFTTAGTTTTYRPYAVFSNASTSGYLGLTAEL